MIRASKGSRAYVSRAAVLPRREVDVRLSGERECVGACGWVCV